MHELGRQQEAFAAALAGTGHAGAATVMFDGAAGAVLDRIAIYRGNVASNTRKALANAYPIVSKVVGAEFFQALAREYQRCHPSTDGNLNRYGEHFHRFVAEFKHTRDLPYLPDVANMEWLAHRAHDAADARRLELEGLKPMLARSPERLVARLAPACALFESRWPLARIWEIHQDGFAGEITVDFDSGPDRILVHRPHFRATVTGLSAGAFRLLQCSAAGKPIDAALESALDVEPDFDLARALREWVEAGIVVALEPAARSGPHRDRESGRT